MKTEILAQYEPPSGDWLISGVVALPADTYAVYRRSRDRCVIDIRGAFDRSIDISAMVTDRQIKHHRLFGFGDGFGLCDQNNTRLLLWPDAERDACAVRVEQSPDSEVQARKRCLAFASFDAADETLLLGLNDHSGPYDIARYWTALDLSPDNLLQPGHRDIAIQWKDGRELDTAHFPQTQRAQWSTSPALEWLSINDGINIRNHVYAYTKGGSHSRSRTGPEYEFSIVARYTNGAQVPDTLGVSQGIYRFSTDKRFFIVKPKRRKCLLVYDLERMALAFEIPLRARQNMAGIEPGHGVSADLRDNRLYVSSLLHLNVCRLV